MSIAVVEVVEGAFLTSHTCIDVLSFKSSRRITMGSGSLGCTVDAEQMAPMQKRRHRQPGRR